MGHNIDMSTGQPAMAYVGESPWHGLGEKIDPESSIEKWIDAAHLNWQILRHPVCYNFKDELRKIPDRHVLIRSDTGAALSVVSDSYCIVQPKEVIEFYRDLVDGSSFAIETAGALDEGRKVWALARSNYYYEFIHKDRIDAYLLLATSCDKSLATTLVFTSIRVVCQNTLQFAMDDIKGKSPAKCLKITHDKSFNSDEAKKQLDLIGTSWASFIEKVNILAERDVDDRERDRFFEELFLIGKKDDKKLPKKAIPEIQTLKSAFVNGKGQELPATKNKAWGLVNAVSLYVDHQRKNGTQSERLNSAWFGNGALLKNKAWDKAVEMFQGTA
jgi:phage/plasmid-like protein (TIGR03299 family)